MAKILDVQFIGADIDKMISDTMKTVDPKKWQKKKNSLINKGLKVGANNILPVVWRKQSVDTGTMRMFTSVKRIKGGGWRIATPTREELAVGHPDALTAKGYYPMSIEMGYKDRGGNKIEGTHAMRDAMDDNRIETIRLVGVFYGNKLESLLKKRARKRKLRN